MSFSYKIIKHIATLSETQFESKQVNVISYNNTAPKIDIRNWFAENKMGKGITLDEEEWTNLGECFNNLLCENDYIEILDNISWLTKKSADAYEINLADFGIDVDSGAGLFLNEEKRTISCCIAFQTDNSKVQKYIEFLNVANKYFSESSIYANAFVDFLNEDQVIKIVGNIPMEIGVTKEMLDALDRFFVEYSDSINEIGSVCAKQIYFENVIVIGDRLSCVHEGHKREELIVVVDFVKENGDKVKIEAKACYCEKCNLFFMRNYDYRVMKSKAGNARMLCQEVEQEKYYRNPDFFGHNMNEHSILNVYGYNVNATEGLSDKQRQEILVSIVDRKVLDTSRVASYLAYFIRLNENKEKDYSDAINKWNRDRDFILDYKVESRRKVEPRKITVIKYRPLE